MSWANGPVTLFHGTDDLAAAAIARPAPPRKHGISLKFAAPLTDFGPAFYFTTNLHQATNWANQRHIRTRGASPPSTSAVVLRFDVDRDALARLDTLWFVLEGPVSSDYWDLIRYCRHGHAPHRPATSTDYDVVVGPVSLWPQTLVIKDCDQVSFHTPSSLATLPTPTIAARGNPFIP